MIYGTNFGALGTFQDGKKNVRNHGPVKVDTNGLQMAKWNAVTDGFDGVVENNLAYL